MVITFPNMGNVALAVKTLFQELQIPYIVPEKNNKKTLQIGSDNSPDEICLPFKLLMGNFIQSIEKGADTILMAGGCGPCRFGEYSELQMKTLRKLGYNNLDFIIVDLSSEISMEEFKNRIGKISKASPTSTPEQIKALHTAYKVLDLSDKIEAIAYNLAGYETNKGECKHILHECKENAMQCENSKDTIKLLNFYKDKINNIKIDKNKDPIKISIVGEIFTVIEPFSNLYIEEKLMDYGVSTNRMLTPSWWVRNFILKPTKLNSLDIKKAARKYLPYHVGGHAKECIGEVVLAKEHGMDGAIQILPLGCMPETIAKSILPTIQNDKDFPIMTLIVDEATAEAGYITRIEAFVDMLKSRKKLSQIKMDKAKFIL